MENRDQEISVPTNRSFVAKPGQDLRAVPSATYTRYTDNVSGNRCAVSNWRRLFAQRNR